MSNIVRIRPDAPATPEQIVQQYEQDITNLGIDLTADIEDDDE